MAIEGAERVATTAIEALKASPSCLVAVLFACVMALLTYFSLRDDEQHSHERSMLMIEKCFAGPESHAGEERK